MNTNRDKTVGNSTETKKLPKLTRKQRAFVNELKKNPKISGTAAALKAYNTSDYNTAAAISSENLKNPKIVSHLNKYNDIIESTISNAITEYSDSNDIKQRTLAVTTAQWAHDKLHGKAIARNINVNATVDIESIIDNLI